MAQTIIGVGDAKAVKKFSAFLAVDVPKKSYWSANFTGEGEPPELPVQRITDLDNGAGDLVTYDLNMLMTMQPVNQICRLAA